MIGAGGVGFNGPSANAMPVAGGGSSVAPRADGAGAPVGTPSAAGDAATNDTARSERTSSANAAVQRDAAERASDHDGASPTDFAALLAANATRETVVPAGTATAASPPKAAPDDADTDTPLPDQLLALLSGSWATPVSAPPASPGVAAEATASSMVATPAAPPVPASPARSPLPGLPVETGKAAPPAAQPAPDASSILLPAESANPLPGIAVDGMHAASDSTPSYDAIAGTVAAPAPMAMTSKVVAPTPPLAMPTDPQTGFDDGLGARIAWMTGQRIGHAEIRLNPEHLGPIEVRVQLDGVRVNAEFLSTHVEVRQAIEASVPRLREMLGQHGLQLGQADVGQRDAARGQAGQGQSRGGHDDDFRARDTAHQQATEPSGIPRLRSRGLLDEYA